MAKRYVIQYCTKCYATDGEDIIEFLECIDEKGKTENFSYSDVLKLMHTKKNLFFIVVNGIHSLLYLIQNPNGGFSLKSASDTPYINYAMRIPMRPVPNTGNIN